MKVVGSRGENQDTRYNDAMIQRGENKRWAHGKHFIALGLYGVEI